MKANVLVNSFNTGEVSELIESRSDLAKYASACKTLENAVPLVEGGAKKMPGTYFAGITAHGGPLGTPSTGKSRLVPFQFSTIQGAILEISAGIIRIWEGASQGSWSLGLALNQPPATDYNPATAYVPGDIVSLGVVYSLNTTGATTPRLTFASPYGQSISTLPTIALSVNSADVLSVTTTGTSPNQGLNIALANTTASNNAASLIQAALRALGSLNSLAYNYIDLSAWTVTPDATYYSTPWITVPAYIFETNNFQGTVQCVNANQNDQFPIFVVNDIGGGQYEFTADWEATSGPPIVIELMTPYQEADLFALDCSTQSADVLWIFHPNYPPAVVERLAANSWQYSLSLPGQEPGEPSYRGTLGVVKTGYSALGQNITLISQSNPCTVVLASAAATQPFAVGSRIYINEGAGMVELNEGEFLVASIAYGSVSITVVNSSGTSSTITGTGWYITLQDPDTLAIIDSSAYLQYAGGGFAVGVVALFAATGDYPACGTLYQERLYVGGSDNNPTQFNGSVEDDYPDFICDPNEDDYAVQFTLVSSQVNPLLNMIGTPNGLAIGTSGGVWIVASSAGSSISQTDVDASLQSSQGVSALQPQLVNGSAIFVSRSARIVTFLVYNFVTNQWENTDLTRLNRNITIGTSQGTSGIAQTAFQVEPYPIFWAVRNDGQLIGLVFNTQDQVYAWFRVNMQGGIVESVAVISGQNQEDQVVIVVNRTINGVTQRYVEYFMPQELFHQLSNGFFVNCGQQFQGVGPFNITGITQANPAVVTAPGHTLENGQAIAIANVQGMIQANTNPIMVWTVAGISGDTFQLAGIDSTGWGAYTSGGTVEQVTNQVTGMSYLLGQTVVAVGDGKKIFEGPVTADAVNFGSYANLVTIGLPYRTVVQPMNPVIGNQQATSKGKKQKFSRATISLYEAIGGLVGTDWQHLHPIDYTQTDSPQSPPAGLTALFTGDVTNDLDADWGDDDTILIVHGEPFPFTLRAVVPRLSAAEEG
jgi:hypothetical protein